MVKRPAISVAPLAAAVAVASATLLSANAYAQLEEVIVTAQKRLESAQDVPIAVTAFDADALTAKQITGFSDIRFTAPSVTYTKANFTGNNFQIRGIGSTLVAASSDSGVGIHVNEVPINSPRLFETEYFDITSVEVLRGPQGTLYGRNSTGGTVNMTTAKAETGDEMYGNFEGQYGDYDHTKIKGHVNIPLGDNFAVRFAGLYLDREGYTDNKYTGNDVDGRDQYSVRGSLAWEPSDDTRIDLMVSYFDEDSNRSRSQKTMCKNDPSGILGCLPDGLDFDLPNPSSQLSNILASDVIFGPLGIFELGSNERGENPNDLRTTISDFEPMYESDETLVTLAISHSLDSHTLNFVAGYQDTEVESEMDYLWAVGDPVELSPLLPIVAPETYAELFFDGQLPMSATSGTGTGSIGGHIKSRNPGLEAYDNSYGTSEQYTFEARIASEYDGKFNWLLGGFYMDVDVHNGYYVFANGFDYLAALTPALTTAQDGYGWVAPQFLSDTDEYTLETMAFFGEVYYDVTDTVSLTVGLRYTDDEKTIKDRQLLLNNDADTGERMFQPLNADEHIPVPYRNDDDDWQETTGRGVINWAVADDSMVYASYSRGYKGGGFNPPFDPLEFPGTAKTFEPEFVDAFEIGTKNIFLDGTLQANATLFYYDYEDLQVSKIINRTSFNENTDAEIFGVEAELAWAPNENWLINGNFSYLDTEVQDFSSIDTRDPTNGSDQVTLVKDLTNASNCVAMIPPALFEALAGSQFSSCSALADAGIPITGGIEDDLSGNNLQNSPEYSFSIGAQYTHYTAQQHALSLRVDYYWQDDMYSRNFNKEVDKIEDWDVWNAQATFTSSNETWYARAFIKNIADDDNLVGMYVTDPSSGMFTNVFLIEPRTYGLALGYNF
jgi:outer membrane receptor protein involved in Fe transport